MGILKCISIVCESGYVHIYSNISYKTIKVTQSLRQVHRWLILADRLSWGKEETGASSSGPFIATDSGCTVTPEGAYFLPGLSSRWEGSNPWSCPSVPSGKYFLIWFTGLKVCRILKALLEAKLFPSIFRFLLFPFSNDKTKSCKQLNSTPKDIQSEGVVLRPIWSNSSDHTPTRVSSRWWLSLTLTDLCPL